MLYTSGYLTTESNEIISLKGQKQNATVTVVQETATVVIHRDSSSFLPHPQRGDGDGAVYLQVFQVANRA
jgi:hypothetical protein